MLQVFCAGRARAESTLVVAWTHVGARGRGRGRGRVGGGRVGVGRVRVRWRACLRACVRACVLCVCVSQSANLRNTIARQRLKLLIVFSR